MIILQKKHSRFISYICFLLFILGWIIYLVWITNLINIIEITQLSIFLFIVMMLIFIFLTRNEVEIGTLTFITIDETGFKIIKPFGIRSVKWADIECIEYNRSAKKNELYIKIIYLIDKGRFKEDINIFYRENVNQYFVKYCDASIINKDEILT